MSRIPPTPGRPPELGHGVDLSALKQQSALSVITKEVLLRKAGFGFVVGQFPNGQPSFSVVYDVATGEGHVERTTVVFDLNGLRAFQNGMSAFVGQVEQTLSEAAAAAAPTEDAPDA